MHTIHSEGPTHLAYVGWAGHGNLGDDAIRDAITSRLREGSTVVDIPDRLSHMRFLGAKELAMLPHSHVFLGGGTIIGRPIWRSIVKRALRSARGRPAYMLGAGVQDPRFHGKEPILGFDELLSWRPILRLFDRVTVRGPRSLDLLAQVGVNASIVGDPALLHSVSELAPVPDSGTIGISLGSDGSTWGDDPGKVLTEVSSVAKRLVELDWKISFLVVNEEDLPQARACADAAAIDHSTIKLATSSAEYTRTVLECRIVLGERLHSLVLAAAAGIPIVALEYQPKSLDFMESIGRASYSLRTDSIAAPPILERIQFIVDHYDSERMLQFSSVVLLKDRLAAELHRMGLTAEKPNP